MFFFNLSIISSSFQISIYRCRRFSNSASRLRPLKMTSPKKVIILMTRQMTQAIGGRTLWRSVKPIYGTTPTTMFSSR